MKHLKTFVQSTNKFLKSFGSKIHVVFDGYGENSTKSSERTRRSSKYLPTEIFFNNDILVTIKQDFLAYFNNKRLIELLKSVCLHEGIFV